MADASVQDQAKDTVAAAVAPVVVTVCTTCKRPDTDPEAKRPGRVLAERLNNAELPEGVTIRGVECLSACSRSCTLLIEGGDARWDYIYGDLDPDAHLDDILAGLHAYAATEDGIVPWRERPVIFRKQSVARIPPLTLPSVDLTKDQDQ